LGTENISLQSIFQSKTSSPKWNTVLKFHTSIHCNITELHNGKSSSSISVGTIGSHLWNARIKGPPSCGSLRVFSNISESILSGQPMACFDSAYFPNPIQSLLFEKLK
jgi:hypothetical protein